MNSTEYSHHDRVWKTKYCTTLKAGVRESKNRSICRTHCILGIAATPTSNLHTPRLLETNGRNLWTRSRNRNRQAFVKQKSNEFCFAHSLFKRCHSLVVDDYKCAGNVFVFRIVRNQLAFSRIDDGVWGCGLAGCIRTSGRVEALLPYARYRG